MQKNVNTTVGGLILLYYYDHTISHSHKGVDNILIENITVHNIQERNQLGIVSNAHNSSAIEIAFNQFKYTIKVKIHTQS